MIASIYRSVMNSERNPLRNLPKTARFQLMVVLSWMWSMIFALWIGSVFAFGVSAAAHLLLLVGVFVTAEVFRNARERSKGYDELFKDPKDGGAMHDDVWGAAAHVNSPSRKSTVAPILSAKVHQH